MSANAPEVVAQIAALDDAAALAVLQAVTKPHLRDESARADWTPDLARALCDGLEAAPAAAAPPPGEIARAALRLLAEDPDRSGPIAALIRNPGPKTFALDPFTGTLLVSAVLFVLKSHVQIERDKQGRWSFQFRSKPATTAQIAPLLKKLVSLIAAGPP